MDIHEVKKLPKTKRCIGCHKAKKLDRDPKKSEFYQHPDMADGHLTRCKACHKSRMRARSAARRAAAGVATRKPSRKRSPQKKAPAKKGVPAKLPAPKKKAVRRSAHGPDVVRVPKEEYGENSRGEAAA